MSVYHRISKQAAIPEWPNQVGWPFIFDRIVKKTFWSVKKPSDDMFTLTEVRTDRLRPLGVDEDIVDEYEVVDPADMPPIVLDESLWVMDGSHRLAAAQRRGDETIWAYVLDRRSKSDT